MRIRFSRQWEHAAVLIGFSFLVSSIAAEEPLKNAAEVQSLSNQQAGKRHEVRLRGVVTFTWPWSTSELTVQDETGAVLLPAVALPPQCEVGALVEIEGRTEAGGFGPIVQPDLVRVIGQAPLPKANPASHLELLAPTMHAQRVSISGVVRGQRVNPELGLNWLALDIDTGGSRLTVNVTHEIIGHPELVDAKVKVEGVNLHSVDPYRQATFPMIFAHTFEAVEVIDPALPKPFDQTATPVNQILRTTNPGRIGRQIRVRGTVTFESPDEDSFFLQDDTGGIEILLRRSLVPQVGESVDVIGFAEPGFISPLLKDADWRPARSDMFSTPISVSAAEALRHDGRLVKIEGRLIDVIPHPDTAILLMENNTFPFQAVIPKNGDERLYDHGSILQVTGVCRVSVGDWESIVTRRKPEEFSILLRDMNDLVMIQPGPWWTSKRILQATALSFVVFISALTFVWIRSRRKLREAVEAREASRIEYAAIFNERGRMSREIHDTLAQGFAGVSAQLEAIADVSPQLPEATRTHLDTARELVRDGLSEARRTVWNLRAQSLEENGLPRAIDQLGHQLTAGRGVAFDFQVKGRIGGIPPDVEHSLLRISQEAISNAIRHASAESIQVELYFEDGGVSLVVSDDGCGFDATTASNSKTLGKFGISGMQERASAMQAELTIQSDKDSGTRIEYRVPNL